MLSIDDRTLRLGAGLEWRWKQDLSTFVQFGYSDHSAESRIGSVNEFDEYSMRFGFEYKLPLYLL